MKFLYSLSVLILFFSCKTKANDFHVLDSNILKIKKINNHIFQHISFIQTTDFGKVACNGMVYINKGEAIIFDTPANNEASALLIDWVTKTKNKSLKAVVVTHFHNDCLGGLPQFHENNVESYANELTITLAKKDSVVLPKNSFKTKMKIEIDNEPVIIEFLGEGHTRDNVVGYIPNEQALFGGCLIKSNNADKGYLGDANVSEWSNTVTAIKQKYSDLEIVIPGHGKPGGTELLDYTITLFKP